MSQKILLMGLMLYVTHTLGQSAPAEQDGSQAAPENTIQLARKSAPKPTSDNIKVIIKDNQIIEEYRQKGELIMVKVIPKEGVPYYLDPQVRDKRTGAYSDLINSGVEPVHWVIKRF